MAPVLDAVFIPLSFVPSFSWEYCDDDFELDFIHQMRTVLKKPVKNRNLNWNPEIDERFYEIITAQEKIIVKTFYHELEQYYKMLFAMSNSFIGDWSFKSANHCDNKLTVIGPYTTLVIEFEQLYVINPYEEFFKTDLVKNETLRSETAHLLYHIKIDTEASSDRKGIQLPNGCDWEDIIGQTFDKIWYNKPFGRRNFRFGYNPKGKCQTLTTNHFMPICENVPIEAINEEKYEIYSMRHHVQKFLAKRHKRIEDNPVGFESFVKKYPFYSEIDKYDDTDNVKFLYGERSEFVCEKNLKSTSWQGSYLHFLKTWTDVTMDFLLRNSWPKKLIL